MLHLGDFEIYLLNDGTVYVDAGGPFGLVPRALFGKILMPNADNLIPMRLTSLLIRAHGKHIVVDTGLGEKLTDPMKKQWNLVREAGEGLVTALARHGLAPHEVDIVINTHLHADHCSGNTVFKPDLSGVTATFPNATYYVQRREYYDATHTNERTRATYFEVNFQPLVESGQMVLLDGDTEIVTGIWGILAPGHTPGMQVIRLESRGQHALFVSDLASYAPHFERLSWMTSYDVEPLITLESKRYWQQWALNHDASIIFQHDPQVNVGKFSMKEPSSGKGTITPFITHFD